MRLRCSTISPVARKGQSRSALDRLEGRNVTRDIDYLGTLRIECTDGEALAVRAAIGALAGATHPDARKTAGDLERALSQRCLAWALLVSLSRWCYTDPRGTYQSGKDAAEKIARSLFGGEVLPRLATDEAR